MDGVPGPGVFQAPLILMQYCGSLDACRHSDVPGHERTNGISSIADFPDLQNLLHGRAYENNRILICLRLHGCEFKVGFIYGL